MLRLKDVSKFYYNKGMISTGFTKINLELKMGEFVVITGESGSGKSTLLNVLSGLDSYEEGEMYINGEETSHYTEKDFEDYRRKYIANIFQTFNLINSYTVYQNVELVLLLNGYKKRQIKKKVLDMIDKVGLTEFKNTKVSKLSGGQKQRVAIARAMVKETPIIVADEPTGNLDSKSAKDIIELLKKVAKDKLVIVVTHNIEQVEDYATRIIKMHDGRILENKEVKKVTQVENVEESTYNKMTVSNIIRLGLRNTFNILPKFLLLFAVFLFITVSLLAEYASFKKSEEETSKIGYNQYFRNLEEERVGLKKQDKSAFTEADYENIKKIENVDYIVENDLLLDLQISLMRDSIYLYGFVSDKQYFNDELDEGRMPENEYEIIYEGPKNNYYLQNRLDEVLNNEFNIREEYSNESKGDYKLKIVGVKYKEEEGMYQYNDGKFYVSKKVIDDFRKDINKKYSKVTTLINGKNYTSQEWNPNMKIVPSDKVAQGKAIVSENVNYLFTYGRSRGKPIKISVENVYYNDELNLSIANYYTKSSIKRLTGYDYNSHNGNIFINPDDYISLFNKPSYQSGLFVKDTDKMEETIVELEKLGINAEPISKFKVNEGAEMLQVVKIFKLVVTCILIFALFFISYFIIRIILKSRNIYFTTVRMLGASAKNVKKILDIELFVNSSLAYFGFMGIIELVKQGIINIGFITDLITYLSAREYILMYVILVAMSKLISRRFSKKLFKKSAIKTYGEEV